MQNARMDSPRTAPYQQAHRRPPYPQPQSLHPRLEIDEDMDLLAHHRNRNVGGLPTNLNVRASIRVFSECHTQCLTTGYRQQQLPGPSMLARQGNMGPAPSQSPTIQQSRQLLPRSGIFDESLRLPPLQTQLQSSTHTTTQRPDLRTDNRDSQAKSVEAMVMSIPYVNKIKVLTKISPPLLPSSPTSPARDIRGVVIAVESADKALLEEIGAFINDHLSQEKSCAVRTSTTIPRLMK